MMAGSEDNLHVSCFTEPFAYYRKSVEHLLKHRFHVHLSRFSRDSFFDSETTVWSNFVRQNAGSLLNPSGIIITIISLSFPVVFIVLGGIAAPALLVSLVGVVRGVLLAAAAALLILSTRVTDPG